MAELMAILKRTEKLTLVADQIEDNTVKVSAQNLHKSNVRCDGLIEQPELNYKFSPPHAHIFFVVF